MNDMKYNGTVYLNVIKCFSSYSYTERSLSSGTLECFHLQE